MNSHALSAILPDSLASQPSQMVPPSAITSPRFLAIRNITPCFGQIESSGGELLLGPIAHCTASTALANSTKRLSPAEPTTRPLNWTIFGSTSSIRSLLRWASVPASSSAIRREQPATSAPSMDRLGQPLRGGWRVFGWSKQGCSQYRGRSVIVQIFSDEGRTAARQCSTVRQVGRLQQCGERLEARY